MPRSAMLQPLGLIMDTSALLSRPASWAALVTAWSRWQLSTARLSAALSRESAGQRRAFSEIYQDINRDQRRGAGRPYVLPRRCGRSARRSTSQVGLTGGAGVSVGSSTFTRSRPATRDVVFAPSRLWTAVLGRLRLFGWPTQAMPAARRVRAWSPPEPVSRCGPSWAAFVS